MDIEKLKQSIYSRLSEFGDVYEYGAVSESAENPYILYRIQTGTQGLNDDTRCRQIGLHIDLFYRSAARDISALEVLTDAVENHFSDVPYGVGDGFVYDITAPIRNEELPTSDEFMFRRGLSYTIRYFESEV